MRMKTNQNNQFIRYLLIGMLGTGIVVIGIVILLDIADGQQNDNISISEQLNHELVMQLADQEEVSTIAVPIKDSLPGSDAVIDITSEPEADKLNREEEKQAETKQTEEMMQQSGGEQASNDGESTNEANGKLDINNATVEQLQTLKGIGPAKAQAIVEDRELKGNFKHIEDLKRVKGIGEKLFAGIKESIVAEP